MGHSSLAQQHRPQPAGAGIGSQATGAASLAAIAEVGAAWKTAPESGNAYLSVKLDSPFLPKPANCALMPQDDGSHVLVWSRDDRRQA